MALGAGGRSSAGRGGSPSPGSLVLPLSTSFFSRPKQTTKPLVPLSIHPRSTVEKSVFQSKTVLFEGASLYCSAPPTGGLTGLT